MAGRRARRGGGRRRGGRRLWDGRLGRGRGRSGFVAQAVRVFRLLALFVLFLGAIHGLGEGFQGLGAGLLDRFFEASRNPFVGLLIGMLATTLVQSSSVTSSLIVGLVAAPESPLPFESAIPMVMGANVGTTVTNTFAALGHLGNRDELRRAFSVATCHDMFNLLAVVVLLPSSWRTGALGARFRSDRRPLRGIRRVRFRLCQPPEDLHPVGPGPHRVGRRPDHRLPGRPPPRSSWWLRQRSSWPPSGCWCEPSRASPPDGPKRRSTGSSGAAPSPAMAVGAVATVLVQSSSVTTSMLIPPRRRRAAAPRRRFPR